MTSAVQEFVKNPGLNYGFIIRLPGEGQENKADECFFGSSEYHINSQKPKLTVTYDMNTKINVINSTEDTKYVAFKRTQKSCLIHIPFKGMSTVTVYDMFGRRCITTQTIGSQWHEIPGVFPQGMYIVSIENGMQTRTRKIWFSK